MEKNFGRTSTARVLFASLSYFYGFMIKGCKMLGAEDQISEVASPFYDFFFFFKKENFFFRLLQRHCFVGSLFSSIGV